MEERFDYDGLLEVNAALREQNRVLRSNLVNCAARLEASYGEDYPAVRDAKAALTATSQPGGKRMKEKIVSIINYESSDSSHWSSVAGFEVITNKQRIKLYIANSSSCCESWGYFWCNDNPQDFVGASLLGVSTTDTALNTKVIESNGAGSRDEGGIMFVNLETNKGVLQFVAYNCHNGYYGHTATVESEQLKHSETL